MRLTLTIALSIWLGLMAFGQEQIPKLSFLEAQLDEAGELSEDNPEKAIPILLELKKASTQQRDTTTLGEVLRLLGNCHYYLDDLAVAMRHWRFAISLAQQAEMLELQAGLFNNIANGYSVVDPDSGIYFYKLAIQIFTELDLPEETTDMLGNLSFTFFDDLQNYDSAYVYANKALVLSKRTGDSILMASMHAQLGRVFIEIEPLDSAIYHAKLGLSISREIGSKRVEELALDATRGAYYANGKIEQAYQYLDSLMVFVYELNELERLAQVTDLESQYEIQLREQEIKNLEEQKARIDKANTRQRVVIISSIVGLCLLLFMGFTMIKEKKRSDELLLNILPVAVAEELKATGKATAKRYESVTVLFTDFKDFSKLSDQMSAEALVEMIDEYFSAFDRVIETYGLEKVKTIGDSYMAAGGIPEPTSEHAAQVIQAAIEMQMHVGVLMKKRKKANLAFFETRIGVHTGPVVAGVVGIKKFAYDIWGDTVNTAARLEKAGEVGQVNISESTFNLVKDRFNCTHRGKIPIKNMGEIDMYFVG